MDQFSVLIVDDNHHMRTLVATVLRACGVREIAEAGDGAEAFDMLRLRTFDVAIVDMKMTPIDGLEFVQLLRRSADSPAPMLPVIMLTAYSERSRVVAARDAGVDAFLVKPFTAAALLNRLKTVLSTPAAQVQHPDYRGPERRRGASTGFQGPERRGRSGKAKQAPPPSDDFLSIDDD